MPLLRTLTTKIKTAMQSPSTSPNVSPTSPQASSFEVVSGRKAGGRVVKRLDSDDRMDSFMTTHSQSSKENVVQPEMKQRRVSKFREELDIGDD